MIVEVQDVNSLKKKYQALSTDLVNSKPPTILEIEDSGSTFYCADTMKGFVWHVDQWYPV